MFWKHLRLILLVTTIAVSFALAASPGSLMVFAGAASRPALQEAAKAFEKKYHARIHCTFGGSGTVLSQMLLTKTGDVYVPGSGFNMRIAEEKGVVKKGAARKVAYLIPVISVQKGNPKKIASLKDLAQPGLKVAIARPGAVCLGDVGVTLLRRAEVYDAVMKNVVTQPLDCGQTAGVVRMKQVDAAIGWDVFGKWYPKDIASVSIPKDIRGSAWDYIPAAVTVYSKRPRLARQWIDFLVSPEGKSIFRKHGYLTEVK
ncbi:MAG: molybdate ABC transporter substrate-binding protein [Armatimonadetes bacterium CG2_30_59_28]|nr:molybdate ABC transporter substrate-binding protein [Armatimonadota bacterium]OIO89473.1 MAG: molybdate ABC transporter substrate-binding protein [Armatimonadetes bacterium CG2_30_59_28]PIU66107.1 MAG: molybdate ABC transporter substrate-binding protein [Armatimonadetes bacterium CG07_land_8_20_14_0_80_59_28]PIX41905.1 MAG: molybdate ABC transporter substrate-binding protein [Armatimonadetes bacterium CG_4_8_14_3_um_filter_58_9]PIY43009.1 MAG: molybdate ABC transporter substrate-binding prot